MLLETGRRPIEMYALIRLLRYITRVRQMDDNRLPKHAWGASTRLQKTRKSKMLSMGWMLDMRRWFKRWVVDRYLNTAPKDVCPDTFLLDLLRAYRARYKGVTSKVAYYNIHIHPSCWELYMQQEAHTQVYIAHLLSVAYRGLSHDSELGHIPYELRQAHGVDSHMR